jgi:NTE family protein
MLGLVLGGGGAKGYAHIGVLKVLEELRVKPDIIVGTSMGSLVGGFYAAGYSAAQIEQLALQIDKKKKRWLFPLRLSRKGFIDGKRVVRYLTPYLGNKRIEDLPVRYAAITFDIESREEVVIDHGELIPAIRASISIPVAFMPHRYAGRVLIDGGFPNPVPVTAAFKIGAVKVIAVNVLTTSAYPQVSLSSKIPSGKVYSMKKILETTMDIISSRLIEYEMTKAGGALLINVNTEGIDISHFEKARPAIERGYKEARRRKNDIQKFINLPNI